MNISYNWLKDLIDLDLSPDETAKALTRVGLAVEGVHPHGDDFVLDIDLTSNRPDCLSHRGVARELGVSLDLELKLTAVETELPMPAVLAGETVQILDPNLCHRFTARVIRGVTIGPSPQWLVDRLEAIGERSINNVADITNYVMHELGQPMHAFDHDKLAEKRIVVRRAKDGEKITSLDEAEHELNNSMVVVCDAERPQGIGGIIGGWDSRITDDTTNVLLEFAYFDRSSVRQTGRKLGITTEAGYRFERGVDVDNIKRASDRATQLICELAGGEKGEFIDIYPKHVEKPTVHSADISAVTKRLTGLDVPTEECDRILHRLGIDKVGAGEYSSPTWRHDIAIEEDLVEEVARHFGYENIATELPPAFGAGEYLRDEERMRRVRQSLGGLGFSEAMSYSFIDETNDGKFALASQVGGETSFVSLKHAVIEGSTRMRPTIIPGLLEALRLNMNFQRRNLKLYEIGKVFIGFGDGQLPSEPRLFSFAITGAERHSSIASDQRGLDFYDAKSVVESLIEELGIPTAEFRVSNAKHLTPGRSADVYIGGQLAGTVGRLSDALASEHKFRRDVFVGELLLDVLLAFDQVPSVYRPLPRFPGVSRDVTFVVGRDMEYSRIAASAVSLDDAYRGVELVGTYQKGDQRTVTVRLNYRRDDRTLTEDEVQVVHDSVLANIKETLDLSPQA